MKMEPIIRFFLANLFSLVSYSQSDGISICKYCIVYIQYILFFELKD